MGYEARLVDPVSVQNGAHFIRKVAGETNASAMTVAGTIIRRGCPPTMGAENSLNGSIDHCNDNGSLGRESCGTPHTKDA